MVKRFIKNIMSKLTAIIMAVVVISFCLAAISCGDDERQWEYAERIAKEEYGCEKILWGADAGYCNELTTVYTFRNGTWRPEDSAFTRSGGTFVLGVDKYGREKFIAVPYKLDVENNPMGYSPRLIQWPFAYSFTEIANFAAEYGYEYAGGIDGLKIDDYSTKIFRAEDIEEFIKDRLANYFEDADKKYDELDVKFMLTFLLKKEDGYLEYCITQENGKLVMYGVTNNDYENYIVTVYDGKNV